MVGAWVHCSESLNLMQRAPPRQEPFQRALRPVSHRAPGSLRGPCIPSSPALLTQLVPRLIGGITFPPRPGRQSHPPRDRVPRLFHFRSRTAPRLVGAGSLPKAAPASPGEARGGPGWHKKGGGATRTCDSYLWEEQVARATRFPLQYLCGGGRLLRERVTFQESSAWKSTGKWRERDSG